MVKPVKAAGLTLAGATPLSAPDVAEPAPPEAPPQPQPPAEAAPAPVKAAPTRRRLPAKSARGEAEDPFADVPGRLRRPDRLKVDMYLRGALAEQVDRVVNYAAYHFRLKKGEVQDLIVQHGLDNTAELMRAMRERAYGETEEP